MGVFYERYLVTLPNAHSVIRLCDQGWTEKRKDTDKPADRKEVF